MTGEIFGRVFLALALAVVPSFLGFAIFLSPAGYPPLSLVALYIQMGGLGVLTLGVLVFWRLYTGAARPSWPFIFFFAGAINIVIWAILTAVTAMGPDVAQAEGFVDLTQSYGIIAFVVAIVWGIAGTVFGWLEKRNRGAEGRG